MSPYLNNSLAVAVHLVNGRVVQDLVPVITLLLSGDQYRDSKGIIYLLIWMYSTDIYLFLNHTHISTSQLNKAIMIMNSWMFCWYFLLHTSPITHFISSEQNLCSCTRSFIKKDRPNKNWDTSERNQPYALGVHYYKRSLKHLTATGTNYLLKCWVEEFGSSFTTPPCFIRLIWVIFNDKYICHLQNKWHRWWDEVLPGCLPACLPQMLCLDRDPLKVEANLFLWPNLLSRQRLDQVDI